MSLLPVYPTLLFWFDSRSFNLKSLAAARQTEVASVDQTNGVYFHMDAARGHSHALARQLAS